jgi:hypothetical protein
MKMNMAIASTRKDTSRMANAGVDTGANMLGVGAAAATTVVRGILPPITYLWTAVRAFGLHDLWAYRSVVARPLKEDAVRADVKGEGTNP